MLQHEIQNQEDKEMERTTKQERKKNTLNFAQMCETI